MSRSDHFVGLNDWARDFFNGQKIPVRRKIVDTYADGKEVEVSNHIFYVETYKKDRYYFCHGYDNNPLSRYILSNGDIYEEYLQECPWSGGPYFFTALRKNGISVPESLWTQQEIDSYM